MAFPQVNVAPVGSTPINTLPNAGQSTMANSLPVTLASDHSTVPVNNSGTGYAASGVSPVSGTFTGTGQSASLTPIAGRGFNISLWGTFAASVQLERSFDGGTTWLPITASGVQLFKWTAPASEVNQEDQASVLYRLNCTSFTSGTVNFRISQ